MNQNSNQMNKSNLDQFMEVFSKHYEANVRANPERYGFIINQLPAMLHRLKDGIKEGVVNKDNPACQATMKELGIKNTYNSLNAFLKA